MSRRHTEMDDLVQEKIDFLERIPPAAIAATHPDLPGAFLEENTARLLDRGGDDYHAITEEFGRQRPKYVKSLVNNPTGYALALLAVGEDGVEQMLDGKLPRHQTGMRKDREGNRVPVYERFNVHHIFQKSAESVDGSLDVNHPDNLVVINTYKSDNNRENAHYYFHALILHPQTVGTAGEELQYFSAKPGFPVYPPCTQPFSTVEEVQDHLHSLDPDAHLPDDWAKKIVAFSKVCGNKAFEVPESYRKLTDEFGDMASLRNETSKATARVAVAEEAANFAAAHLPAGATVRGEVLPDDHIPAFPIPIIDSEANVTWPKGVRKPEIPGRPTKSAESEGIDKPLHLPEHSSHDEEESSSIKH